MENLTNTLSEKDATLVKLEAMLRNSMTLHKRLRNDLMDALEVKTPNSVTWLVSRRLKLTNAKRLAIEDVLNKYEVIKLAE